MRRFIAVFAFAVAFAYTASAQDLGATFHTKRLGDVTVGPSAAIALAAYEPGGSVRSGFMLAPGLGVSIYSERPYAIGLSGAMLVPPASLSEPPRAAVLLSFAKILRLGYGYGGRFVFALGIGP